MINQFIIFFVLFIYCSPSFPMSEDENLSEAPFKGRIEELKAQGTSNEEITRFANDYLDSFIEDSYDRGMCEEAYSLDFYMKQFNMFLEAGADKNVKLNFTGTTALMFAASANRPDIFKALVAIGVDPTLTDRDGHTAGEQPRAKAEIKGLFQDAVKAWNAKK